MTQTEEMLSRITKLEEKLSEFRQRLARVEDRQGAIHGEERSSASDDAKDAADQDY